MPVEGWLQWLALCGCYNPKLANGRLAMMVIIGMILQNGTFGAADPEIGFPSIGRVSTPG
eukprot:3056514-Prorocentrum_lima.AAC.1